MSTLQEWDCHLTLTPTLLSQVERYLKHVTFFQTQDPPTCCNYLEHVTTVCAVIAAPAANMCFLQLSKSTY